MYGRTSSTYPRELHSPALAVAAPLLLGGAAHPARRECLRHPPELGQNVFAEEAQSIEIREPSRAADEHDAALGARLRPELLDVHSVRDDGGPAAGSQPRQDLAILLGDRHVEGDARGPGALLLQHQIRLQP